MFVSMIILHDSLLPQETTFQTAAGIKLITDYEEEKKVIL
jgi:hypothetical protein